MREWVTCEKSCHAGDVLPITLPLMLSTLLARQCVTGHAHHFDCDVGKPQRTVINVW